MEPRACEPETEATPMDDDHSDVCRGIKLGDLIGKGSLEEWISLISRTETTYPDDLDTICLVYDAFLSEFPLCHGYWRKYADWKIKLSSVEEVVDVFERAVQSATYSVSVWVDYCTFSMLVFEDPDDIRRLFRRGISYVGTDYLCHELWDLYIKFELSQEQWSMLAQIYIEALRYPTEKLHCYYDGFKKLASLCNKELGSQGDSGADSPSGFSHEEVPKKYRARDISSLVKELFEPSISFARSKELLRKYLSIGEYLYHEASQMDEKISHFEANVRRSYFHVKSLDFDQLQNWHHYLDFLEMHGNFDWVVKLYERCLIPCANYPEFWMRYVEFMETKGGREIANYALDRATKVFLKKVPMIHIFNSRFKEYQGDVIGARSAVHCDSESDLEFVESVVIEANIERRQGNLLAASNIFEEAISMAAAKKKLDALPSLYVHFARLKQMITDNPDYARDVLIDGIKHVPDSKLLFEELMNFASWNGGERNLPALVSILDDAICPAPGVPRHLNEKDAEDVSNLYLKYIDLYGTIHEVRKAWNQHLQQFPHSTRKCFNETLKSSAYDSTKCPSPGKSEKINIKSEEVHNSEVYDHGATEMVELESIQVSEQPVNASLETTKPSNVSEKPREFSAECRIAEGAESEQATKELSNGNSMECLSLDELSLHPREPNLSVHLPDNAPLETSNAETDQQNQEESSETGQKTTNAFGSLQVTTEQPPRPHFPADGKTGNNQTSEPQVGQKRHLDRMSHQHQPISSQHHQVESANLEPMDQTHHGSQAQQHFQATPSPNNPWPLQPNEHGMQNGQSYNEMWQYYYYQQHLFMQQQHHLQPSQLYQNQQQISVSPPYQYPHAYQQPRHQQQFYQPPPPHQQFYQPPPPHQRPPFVLSTQQQTHEQGQRQQQSSHVHFEQSTCQSSHSAPELASHAMASPDPSLASQKQSSDK